MHIDVRNPHNPEIKGIFDRAEDLSDEEKENKKKELHQRARSLNAELKAEKDAKTGGELERKIEEVKEVLGWIDIHATQLDTVIDRERTKITERRRQAAEEFELALVEKKAREGTGADLGEAGRLSESEERFRDWLATKAREPIGLAFSGGGIRSAIFNLGVLQGLGKYGFLPWIDYLTSVSGGGLIAACMTTLLSMHRQKVKGEEGKREYYHFNTQWDYFPFNPELKVFDGERAGHTGRVNDQVRPTLERGPNEQLKHLRDKGNYIIPRMGWLTRDVLRAMGATLLGVGYTVSLFLVALIAFSAFHYGLAAALTPGIQDNINLSATDIAALVPREQLLLATLLIGFAFSGLCGLALEAFYGRNPTREFKLNPWARPEEDVTLETFDAINNIRVVALICFFGLLVASLCLWISRLRIWSETARDLRDSYWAWGFLFILLASVAGWLILRHTADYGWAKAGLPEQLRIDNLVTRTVAVLGTWAMTLWIAWSRFLEPRDPHPQIFWIWMPAVFILGSLVGLAVLRILPLYINRIDWPGKGSFNISRWSDPAFRSIFWTLQGLGLCALIASLVLAILLLPHYFSVGVGEDSSVMLPLATVIISAGWAAFLSSVNQQADFQAQNLVAKAIALPAGLRNYVLGLLVVLLNLALIFLVQSRIDGIEVRWACAVCGAALVVFWLLGRFVNFNYLTPHYFARDRISEAFMKTEVVAKTGQVKLARDDCAEPLRSITPQGCSAPYHIVLTSLNLPGSWLLELKDRKSQPFIFSKYYCGSEITGYARTEEYRDGKTKYCRAIALSGAAVSPGLGYHTNFAQAFMTTLLNVRLGLWMISPSQYRLDLLGRNPTPHAQETRVFWPTYLADEALGRISERRPLINLTDGEHTGDGIGLYPLFQRRCKIIIAGDGSGDPAGHASGLYRVIRQVKVDMGIEVEINIDGTKPAVYDRERNLAEPSQRHFAVGRITYPPKVDAEGKELSAGFQGWLVYFKTAVTRRDPKPILNYWETHKMDFPSPTTADQFFDEEQWEFQRWLGEFTIEHILRELKRHCDRRIEAEKDKGGDPNQAEIEKLRIQRKLAEGLLARGSIDHQLVTDHPDLYEWVMSTLCDLSTSPDGEET